ncbi:MAG: pseudouridine synthase [Bacteroidota bacterium]
MTKKEIIDMYIADLYNHVEDYYIRTERIAILERELDSIEREISKEKHQQAEYRERPDREKRSYGEKPERGRREYGERPDREKRSYGEKPERGKREYGERSERGRGENWVKPERGRGEYRERPEGGREGYRGKSESWKKSDPEKRIKRPHIVRKDGDDTRKSSFSEEPRKEGYQGKPKIIKIREEDHGGEELLRPARPKRDDGASRQQREEFGRTKPYSEREKSARPEKREFREERPDRPERSERPSRPERSERPDRPVRTERYERSERPARPERRGDSYPSRDKERGYSSFSEGRGEKKRPPARKQKSEPGSIRLNKYIADAGICSRREADKLIESGEVTVNGKVVTVLGTKVMPSDIVQYADAKLSREKLKYVLLNKPKGFITTTDDPEERKTVMNLIANACKERIYPVGRLDRNTTGLLLFTNDGELAKKLMHPKHGVRKVYHAVLDKPLTKKEILQIREGIELEDGLTQVDAIEYSGDGKDKKQIGIEIHSGKNRIVRRIFEQLGYEVTRLDRVTFAGMTKKNLPRGEWRFLDEKEVSFLKMLS